MKPQTTIQIARWTVWALLHVLALWLLKCASDCFSDTEKSVLVTTFTGRGSTWPAYDAHNQHLHGWIFFLLSCASVIAANYWLWLLRPTAKPSPWQIKVRQLLYGNNPPPSPNASFQSR